MGLSLTARQPDELVVCGPRLQHSCGKNEYLNGVCFTLDRSLNVLPSNYTPGYQECTSKPVDIVFLIDGSGSIKRNEFSQMKVFMQEIINRFQGRGANFAVVQYSNYIRLEFDFNKYTSARSAADLINNIVQIGSSTRTAAGIKYVAINITFIINMMVIDIIDIINIIVIDIIVNINIDIIVIINIVIINIDIIININSIVNINIVNINTDIIVIVIFVIIVNINIIVIAVLVIIVNINFFVIAQMPT
nr:PREDICTED: integrin alpha-X-like [Lepisosteus oculatus]